MPSETIGNLGPSLPQGEWTKRLGGHSFSNALPSLRAVNWCPGFHSFLIRAIRSLFTFTLFTLLLKVVIRTHESCQTQGFSRERKMEERGCNIYVIWFEQYIEISFVFVNNRSCSESEPRLRGMLALVASFSWAWTNATCWPGSTMLWVVGQQCLVRLHRTLRCSYFGGKFEPRSYKKKSACSKVNRTKFLLSKWVPGLSKI